MKRKRRKKTRIGSSILALALLAGMAAGEKKPKVSEVHGLIAVTVFREPGFALPGADLTLEAFPVEPGSKHKLKGVSDARGEYVFRIPVEAKKYSVGVSAKGLVSQEKVLAAEGEQRFDVTFLLAAESKH